MPNQNEICYSCGNSVAQGSGRFVNRIPSFDDKTTREEIGWLYPDGEFMCAECELMLKADNIPVKHVNQKSTIVENNKSERFFVDIKATIWERHYFSCSPHQFTVLHDLLKEGYLDSIFDDEYGFEVTETMYDTMETISPTDNGGEETACLVRAADNEELWNNRPEQS